MQLASKRPVGTGTSAGLVSNLSCPKPLPISTWADTLAHLTTLHKNITEFIGAGNYIAPMLASNGMVAQRIQRKTYFDCIFSSTDTNV